MKLSSNIFEICIFRNIFEKNRFFDKVTVPCPLKYLKNFKFNIIKKLIDGIERIYKLIFLLFNAGSTTFVSLKYFNIKS